MSRLLLLVFLLLPLSSLGDPTNGTRAEEDPDAQVLARWDQVRPRMEAFVKSLLNNIFPVIMRSGRTTEISSSCMRSLLRVVADLRKLKIPALNLLDASGKPPAGILTGRLSSFGEFDQCLNLKYPADKDGKKVLFTGQYCTLEMRPPLPPRPRFHPSMIPLPIFKNFLKNYTAQGGPDLLNTPHFEINLAKSKLEAGLAIYSHFFYFNSYRLGVCVPSTCTKEDIAMLVKPVESMIVIDTAVPRCETKENIEFQKEQLIIVAFLSALLFLVILGTSLDAWDLYYPSNKLSKFIRPKLRQILLAFSAYSNGRAIIKVSAVENSLSFLAGIRVLTVSWIVLGHTYFLVNYQNVRNTLEGLSNVRQSFLFQIITNGTVSVDTFFVLSGLLVTYSVLKMGTPGRPANLNIPMFIIRRAWRLLPGMLAAVGLFLLVPWLGSRGPMWRETIEPLVEDCHKNWWTNLLFINNVVNNEHICLLHTWFISADFQLHLLSLLVLLPLLRWPIIGIAMACLLILISTVISVFVFWYQQFPPTMLIIYPDPKDLSELWRKSYLHAWAHVGPYMIGMMTGYVIATKNWFHYLRENRVITWIGWLLSTGVSLTIIFITFHWNRGNLPVLGWSVVYASTHRTLWAMCIAWIIYNCVEGGTVISDVARSFLSWKAFIPLSRLVFMVYLLHYPLIVIFNAMLYEYHFNHRLLVWQFFGHLSISTLLAFPACLLFESPFIRLEKVLLSSLQHRAEGKDEKPFGANSTAKLTNGLSVSSILSSTEEQLNSKGEPKNFAASLDAVPPPQFSSHL